MRSNDCALGPEIVCEQVSGSLTSIAENSEADYVSSGTVTIGSSAYVLTSSSTSVDSGVFIDRRHRALPETAGLQMQHPETHQAVELDADDEFGGHNVPTPASSSYSGCCSCCRRGVSHACRTVIDKGRQAALGAGELIGSVDLGRRTRQLFSLRTIKDRLPITHWMPQYRYGVISSAV
jgi:hypothetical protein